MRWFHAQETYQLTFDNHFDEEYCFKLVKFIPDRTKVLIKA